MRTSRRLWIALLPFGILFPACRKKHPPGDVAANPPPDPPLKGETPASDSAFVGLGEAEGAALAKERGLSSRVVEVDGVPRPATRDYRRDRVNFTIKEGRITGVTRG